MSQSEAEHLKHMTIFYESRAQIIVYKETLAKMLFFRQLLRSLFEKGSLVTKV